MSGSISDRDAFNRLRDTIRSRQTRVDIVVAEALDRITRDGEVAQSFLKLLQRAGTELVLPSDGIHMDEEASLAQVLTYGVTALLGQVTLINLRAKTRRGLELKASEGRSTGGLPLGYQSIRHLNSKGINTGSDIAIEPEGAAVVRRIFELYRDGNSYRGIAILLNQGSVDTPRKRMGRSAREGWIDSTVRAILKNRSYIGEWIYGARVWSRNEKGKRQAEARDPEEVMKFDRPHLRIIDQDLWDQVHARLDQVANKYGSKKEPAEGTGLDLTTASAGNDNWRPADGPKQERKSRVHPFSGLLLCHCCGGPMVIVGGSVKYYRCNDSRARGTCPNNRLVREDALLSAILTHLTFVLRDPSSVGQLQMQATVALQKAHEDRVHRERKAKQDLTRVQNALSNCRRNLLADDLPKEALRDMSDTLKQLLEAEEDAKAELALAQAEPVPAPIPSTEGLRDLAAELERRVAEDPLGFREVLRRMTAGGHITLEPQPDGSHVAHTFFFPLLVSTKPPRGGRRGPGGGEVLLLPSNTQKPQNLGDSGASGSVCTATSCAGWI